MIRVRRTLTVLGAVSSLFLLTPLAAQAASPGDLDPTFGGGDGMATVNFGSDGLLATVLATTGGKILVMGENDTSDLVVARTAPNGDPDGSFGGGDGVVTMHFLADLDTYNALSVLPGGKIMAAVDTVGAGHDVMGLGRFTSAGVADPTFGGGDGKLLVDFGKTFYAYDLRALGSGKMLVSGEFVVTNDDTRFLVARLNPNGSLDHSFGGGDGFVVSQFGPGADGPWRIALDAQGRIVVAGWAQEGTGPGYDAAIARYTPNGAPDHAFSGDGRLRLQLVERSDDYALGLGLQGDKIVVGSYASFEDARHVVISRCLPNGQMDQSFGGGDGQVITPNGAGERELDDLAVDSDGRILVSGRAEGSPDQMFVARYGPNGKLDTGFGTDGFAVTAFGTDATNYAMSVGGNGKIVIGGQENDPVLARFLP
jgi:uncharacterized delta-60 repeat protein